MKLKALDGINKNELSMVEVAHAILETKQEVMDFNQLLVEVQSYMELSDEQLEARMARFYTDLNIDGSFISLGENRWGLRSWYPIDSIDEEIVSSMDDEDLKKRRKKRKKVNTFGSEEDLIDYNDDDPEDEDGLLEDEEDDDDVIDLDDDVDDEEETELDTYRSDLSELGADEDLDDEVSADEDLSIINDDELESD
ncbi:DNA-directed RNA polymerase subunit delta [Granulicatella elegans]|uniref:DNA-directed RNA polymerase subunit delta n=1 Tax=Granulicatella elegans TaxID=137732 RepID=UPI001D1577AF|nr:DNA-directed RNA polymerase subunit delta [Granulicatella elegans]UEA31727.1 DNA-directed RNA polymerase subunit delta [Granulicatella elegans]